MYTATVNCFDEWRALSRAYLSANISPDHIQWSSGQQGGLFPDQHPTSSAKAPDSRVAVPQRFISRVKQASHYIGQINSGSKWSLFYSLLWRITKIDRDILLLKSDSQMRQLELMAKSVSRDMHKMKAFVRFKSDAPIFGEIDSGIEGIDGYYIAWFEPEHAIIEPIAPFFVKRFTNMNWSILTPHGCAHWNRKELIHSPGISRPDIQEDEFDDFWRAYYRSIFNPARLKEKAMRNEMPKKYWKYLPESVCIGGLASSSAARVGVMANTRPTDSERVRQRSRHITDIQDQLRKKNCS